MEESEVYVLGGRRTGEVIVRSKSQVDSYRSHDRGVSFVASDGKLDEAEPWDYGRPSGRWLNVREVIFTGKMPTSYLKALRSYNFKDGRELDDAIEILEGYYVDDHLIQNSKNLQRLADESQR